MIASKIEWTDRSDWNPIRGCTRVSPGCVNCYAEASAGRFSGAGQPFHGYATKKGGEARWTGKIDLIEDRLTLPLRWKKPARIFVSSTSDLFHESLPDEAIDRIFAVMALAPQHTFQVLTKRADRMREYMDKACGRLADAVMRLRKERGCTSAIAPLPHIRLGAQWWPLPNVWLGVSVEDQQRADERIPDLLATPAAVRWISAEPLLGPVDLTMLDATVGEKDQAESSGLIFLDALTGVHRDAEDSIEGIYGNPDPKIDWVITGGESGPNARPMHPDWARSLRDQCAAAGVPFFFKQWGEWGPDTGPHVYRLGKKQAGRLLDGREWSEFPA
jgi:protein gp37